MFVSEVIIYIFFSIYWLIFFIALAIGIIKRKIIIRHLQASPVYKFISGTLAKQKNKFIKYIPVFFIYSTTWPFLIVIILFYYKYFKRKKITYKPGLIGIYSSLHAHAEWLNLLLCFISIVLVVLSYSWILPSNLYYLVALSNLLYVTSYCFYNLISEPGMLGRIKVSVFNLRLFYIIVLISIFILFILSFSFLKDGASQEFTSIIETCKEFLLINQIKDWLDNKPLTLSPIYIVMGVCTAIFTWSSTIKIRDLILLKRDDKDLMVMAFAWIVVGKFEKANESIKLISKLILDYEKHFLHLMKAIILINRQQNELAVNEIKDLFKSFKGTKYHQELSCYFSLSISFTYNIETEKVALHYKHILDYELPPIVFYLIVQNYFMYQKRDNPSLKRHEIMPQNSLYKNLQLKDIGYRVLYHINSTERPTISDTKKLINSIGEENVMNLLLKYYLITAPGLAYEPGNNEQLSLIQKDFSRISKIIAEQINVNTDSSVLLFLFIIHPIVKNTLFKNNAIKSISILDKKITKILNDKGYETALEWFKDSGL